MENIVRVKLQGIVDAISMQFDDQQQFINLETGEVTLVQDEHFRMAENIEDLEQWYCFEQDALREIALTWCSENKV